MDHLERMYALHQTLRVRRHPAPTSELMDLLECSRSTLHRTIGHMRDYLGAPILNTPGRGYFYDKAAGKFELPGLWIRRGELEALLVMDHLLEGVQPGILNRYIEPLRAKLQQILDVGVTGALPFPTHRVRILRTHARSVPMELFVPAASALIERRQLAFTYAGRVAGTVTRRVASPQRLVYYRDQWYLDCWDEGKDALRTFSIDRIPTRFPSSAARGQAAPASSLSARPCSLNGSVREAQPQHGMPDRPIPVLVDVEGFEQRLVSFEQFFHRVQQQTLAELPWAGQEVALASVQQAPDIACLVYVVAVPFAKFAE